MAQRVILLQDLYQFCIDTKIKHFKAETKEETIVVSLPAQYTVQKYFDDTADDRFLSMHIKACHTLENLNGSAISETDMDACKNTIHNCPILGAVKETMNADGTVSYDFNGHDMEIIEDPFNAGETRINYIERVIGTIPADAKITLEAEEGSEKKFLHTDGLIYTEHGNLAADILKRREDVACSVEIAVDELEFDAKKKIMNITSFRFLGCTLLGADVKEGMKGSRAYINYEESHAEKLDNLTNKMNEILEKFDNTRKGGDNKTMDKINELMTKYNITIDDINFEYGNMSDEELEAKFAEVFSTDAENPVIPEEFSGKRKYLIDDKTQTMTISYEISHEDIRYGLYNLLDSICQSDNDWYYISNVYDNTFIYENWDGTKIYRQGYSKDGDNIAFDGDRIELFKELLTANEKANLEEMRSNYARLCQYEIDAEAEKAEQEKTKIFEDASYAQLADYQDFKNLIANSKALTIEQVQEKADLVLAKYVKQVGNFTRKPEPGKNNTPRKVYTTVTTPGEATKKPYGGLFEDFLKE